MTPQAVATVKSSFKDAVLLQRFPPAPSVNDILVSWCLVETFSQTVWAHCHITASGKNYNSALLLSQLTLSLNSGGGDISLYCKINVCILDLFS